MKIPKLNKTYHNYLIDKNGCLWEKVDSEIYGHIYEKREPFLHKGRMTYLLFTENLKFSKVNLENAAKLVLNTYYPNDKNLSVIFKDGNPRNLELKNLEWGLIGQKIQSDSILVRI